MRPLPEARNQPMSTCDFVPTGVWSDWPRHFMLSYVNKLLAQTCHTCLYVVPTDMWVLSLFVLLPSFRHRFDVFCICSLWSTSFTLLWCNEYLLMCNNNKCKTFNIHGMKVLARFWPQDGASTLLHIKIHILQAPVNTWILSHEMSIFTVQMEE